MRAMQAAGVPPDAVSYNLVVRSHAEEGDTDGLAHWLGEMRKAGLDADVSTYNGAIQACARRGDGEAAREWLREMARTARAANQNNPTASVRAFLDLASLSSSPPWTLLAPLHVRGLRAVEPTKSCAQLSKRSH